MGIPFSGLSTLIALVVMSGAWLFIYNRIRKTQAAVSRPVRLLHNFFLLMALFFLFMALPHLWLYINPAQFPDMMAWGYTIGHAFLYVALTCITRMIFIIIPRLVDKEKYAVIGGTIFNVVITLITAMTMIYGTQPTFDYATGVTQFNAAPVVGALIGVAALLSLLPASVLFLTAAFKGQKGKRRRPLLLGLGLSIITIAGPLHDTAISVQALFVTDAATVAGIIILGSGVVYRLEQSLVIRPAVTTASS